MWSVKNGRIQEWGTIQEKGRIREVQMSWINLTDELYGLFKTDKHANEVRKMDCKKILDKFS